MNNEDLKKLVELTKGYSGADIRNLSREVKLFICVGLYVCY